MIFSEQQFERFSKPPFKYETQLVVDTHTEIRTALNSFYDKQAVKEKYNLAELPDLEIFLQGSYKNDTNITKSSDVDIVVRIKNVWRADISTLSANEAETYKNNSKDSTYTFALFNQDIMNCLKKHFGDQLIINDDKCLRLRKHGKFCDADIVPANTYKLFGTFPSADKQKFTEGICFDTNEGKQIINFPKQHQEALADKSGKTDGNFKETVRMFKNLKDELIDHGIISKNIAKSHYIENLLFNVPHGMFSGLYKDRFLNVLAKLITDFNSNEVNNYKCANGTHKLISDKTWSIDSLRQFLVGLTTIRDKNEF